MFKRLNLPLLTILLIALIVRLVSLADHSLWYDEAFSVLFAKNDLNTMLSGTVNAIEHPLLYYISLSGWMRLLGDSVFVIRLWSVLTGLATIAIMVYLARELFTQKTAYAAALLMTFAPFHLQYSQEARMYSLMALLLMLTTYCYLRGATALKSDATGMKQWGYWLGFGIFAGLAMHTQQLAAFYLLALGLIPLLTRQWGLFLRVSMGAVLALLLFSSWLLNLPAQLAQLNANYWIEQPTVAQPLLSLGIFYGGYHEYAGASLMLIYGGAIFLTIFVLLQVLMQSRNIRYRQMRGNVLFVLWLFIAPLGFMWLFSQVIPVYLERALIASVLMLLLLLAWFFTESAAPRLFRYPLLAICVLMFVLGMIQQYSVNSFPYVPVHDAMTMISAESQAGDVVMHDSKLTMLPAQVYAPELDQHFIADIEGSPQDTLDVSTQAVLGVHEDVCLQVAATGAERVWYLTLQRAEREYQQQNNPLWHERQAWLDDHFTAQPVQTFNDLNVYLYTGGAVNFTSDCDS